MKINNKDIIIALDFNNKKDVISFLKKLKNEKLFVKVGMELFYSCGTSIIKKIKKMNHKIFLDLKLHDIPNTVYQSIKSLLKLNVDIISVHASGGSEMLKKAAEAIKESNSNTKLVAITQLTSTSEEMMKKEQKINSTLLDSVINYACLSKDCGIDGVVCSVWETKIIKNKCGNNFIVINPGIRTKDDNLDDQKRIATPNDAKINNSDYIVVGRSITKNKNCLEKYLQIKKDFLS
ncbi:orotidine-5'-phosphate decarboxylase [Malacoplasma iowae]|uniref:Orotidine 5'-phosphate decarboxylase n=1 Tax=Malacoplasma iowae 695 TaxID=1048830 RepID=A0A6P1LFP2_MALIO|nr:orotidine-5'-phosphate decarboxylase [Malacoplasma iowae]VEU62952.1 Orotidine 5'-phosphate decarboxylase [Mycoplasmopsis fermentans]EGZ31743.1 orotidine 5'-phosphate decarboxylase [Malacoplasma iowae 695]QHG90278.2 orotidine-5'-phosphate decarboxylase [Malacoplasma iowae 695]WPL35815.1 orotidine-5'-phosphate decarboxylase [Malacoplasma iowae]VEU71703.1 Orotidine 5'-phosphate decarboxylase [Malacoplasma iowae]